MKLRLLAPLLLLALPNASAAARLHASIRAAAEFDDNVFNASEGEQSDVLLGAGFGLGLESERERRLRWSLRYDPRYQHFLDFDDLDDWMHVLRGQFEYGWSETTSIWGRGRFSHDTRSSRREPVDADAVDPGDPETSRGGEAVDRAELGLALSHRFSPRLAGVIDVDARLARYEADDRSDSDIWAGAAALDYALSPRQSVGLGLRYAQEQLDEADDRDARRTRFATLFGAWNLVLDPLWTLSARAGPTWIDPDDGAAFGSDGLGNPIRFEGGDDALTLFADVSIGRVGQTTRFTLGFSRSEGDSFGGRVSMISSALRGVFVWDPSKYWTLVFRASYSRREAAAGGAQAVVLDPLGARRIDLDDEFDVDTLTLGARANRRFTKRLSGFAELLYWDQDGSGRFLGDARDASKLRATLGVIYRFDPVPL